MIINEEKGENISMQKTLVFKLLGLLVLALSVIGVMVFFALSNLGQQAEDNSFVSVTLKVEREIDVLQKEVIRRYNNDEQVAIESVERLDEEFHYYVDKVTSDELYADNEVIGSNLENIHRTIHQLEAVFQNQEKIEMSDESFKLLTTDLISLTDYLEDNKGIFVLRVRDTTSRVSRIINGVGLVSVGFAVLIYFLLIKRIIYPLRKITKTISGNVESYVTDEIDYDVDDELGLLVRHYNQTIAQMNSLQEINVKINQFVDFHESVEFVYKNFKRFIPYNRIGVSVIADHGTKVRAVELMTDGKVELGSNYSIDLESTSLGKLAKSREVRIINDLEAYYASRPTSESTAKILQEGIKSSLTLPLCVADECIGFLFFSSNQKDVYNQRHVGFLRIVADHLAITIQKSFRHDDLILTTINGFAKLVESRDSDTGNHVDRMKSYCELLARLAFKDSRFSGIVNEKILFTISRYSALHDIGKIAIPDAILLKNGKLTKEEFDVIKTHPVIGGDILKDMGKKSNRLGTDIFKEAIEIVRYHHEKYDGTGYPEGLKGNQIPIVARIVAIGDVFDALSSKRVYKNEIGFEKSMEILAEGSGKHFDPALIDIIMENKDELYKLYLQFHSND